MLVVCGTLFCAVCCLLSVCCVEVGGWWLFVGQCALSVVVDVWCAVYCVVFVAWRLPVVVWCCLLCAGCCLLIVVCCMLCTVCSCLFGKSVLFVAKCCLLLFVLYCVVCCFLLVACCLVVVDCVVIFVV